MRQMQSRPLWIGNSGDLRNPQSILLAGIQAVVELADSEPMAVLPREIIRCRFPLSDGVENPEWLLRLAAETVASLIREGIATLVVCSAGMSRSVCVAAAGIALSDEQTLEEAVALVTSSGPVDISPALLSQMMTVLKNS